MVSSIRSCEVIKLIPPTEMYHAGGGFVARGYTRAMNVPLNGWYQGKSSGIFSRSTMLRTAVGGYLALATISSSSTSNTKVAPGLMVGGAPLSP